MKWLARLVFAAAFLALSLTQSLAVERILQFISDCKGRKERRSACHRNHPCQAEGREIRRGILRDFPTTYTASDGRRVRVGFTVLSVTRNGAPENFATEPSRTACARASAAPIALCRTGRTPM